MALPHAPSFPRRDPSRRTCLAAGLLFAVVIGCGPANEAARDASGVAKSGASATDTVTTAVATRTPAAEAPARDAVTAAPAPASDAAAPAPAVPASPPATPSGPLRAQDPGAYRPCELEVQSCTQQGKPCVEPLQCAITLIHVIPEGEPLDLLLTEPKILRWRYAADERVLEGPWHVYEHTGPTKGVRSRKEGGEKIAVQFDERGRLRQRGRDVRLEYTPDGRTAGISTRKGSKWAPTVTYAWAPNHSYEVHWTYPDADEFCEPSPSTVDLDEQGRVVRQVYADCQINYSEFTLSYHYDATGRADGIDVQCRAESPEALTWRLALKYECP